MLSRKLPAYGKRIADAVQHPQTWRNYTGTSADGQRLTIWIAIGTDAWTWARERMSGKMLIAVIPENEDPESLNLSFIKNHDPILIQQCGEISVDFIKAVVTALIRQGAQRVLAFADNGATLFMEAAA